MGMTSGRMARASQPWSTGTAAEATSARPVRQERGEAVLVSSLGCGSPARGGPGPFRPKAL
jgi:hypothetical protein